MLSIICLEYEAIIIDFYKLKLHFYENKKKKNQTQRRNVSY